ncbi:MAG: hypothetical protein Q9187_003411 [Circinaria calcarea]
MSPSHTVSSTGLMFNSLFQQQITRIPSTNPGTLLSVTTAHHMVLFTDLFESQQAPLRRLTAQKSVDESAVAARLTKGEGEGEMEGLQGHEASKNKLQGVEELAKGVSQLIEEPKNKDVKMETEMEVKMETEMEGLVDGVERL